MGNNSIDLKALNEKTKQKIKEVNAKKDKTIKDYIEIKTLYSDLSYMDSSFYDDMRGIILYNDLTEDDTILTEFEYNMAEDFALKEGVRIFEISRFIKDIKRLEIEKYIPGIDKFDIGVIICKFYNPVYFANPEIYAEIVSMLPGLNDKKKRQEFSNYLELQEDIALEYIRNKTDILDKYFERYERYNTNSFVCTVYDLAEQFDYNLEKLFKEFPSDEVITKDLEDIQNFSEGMVTARMYNTYMTKDKSLSEYNDDFGYYRKPKMERKIRVTKQEFLASIKDRTEELEELKTKKPFSF